MNAKIGNNAPGYNCTADSANTLDIAAFAVTGWPHAPAGRMQALSLLLHVKGVK